MLHKLLAAICIASPCASLIAGEIQGVITDEQGIGLKGVRVCLSVPDTAPGECAKARYSDKNGKYVFKGMDAAQPYTLRVLTGASLTARKADPYPKYAWEPVTHDVSLASRKDRAGDVDFVGSFNFSNFQAEFQLGGNDFPELANYDLANDYVFLKIYTADSVSAEQNLIFLGQITDISSLFIEVSVPLSATELIYEIYSAAAPEPVIASINLISPG
jgi:hypothetical protein